MSDAKGREAMERVLAREELLPTGLKSDIHLARAHLSQLYAAAAEREALMANVEELREANHSIAVCRNHTGDVVGTGCLVCDLASAEKVVEATRSLVDHFASVMGGPLIAGSGITFEHGVEGIPTIFAARTALRSHDAERGEGNDES